MHSSTPYNALPHISRLPSTSWYSVQLFFPVLLTQRTLSLVLFYVKFMLLNTIFQVSSWIDIRYRYQPLIGSNKTYWTTIIQEFVPLLCYPTHVFPPTEKKTRLNTVISTTVLVVSTHFPLRVTDNNFCQYFFWGLQISPCLYGPTKRTKNGSEPHSGLRLGWLFIYKKNISSQIPSPRDQQQSNRFQSRVLTSTLQTESRVP